MKIKRTLGVKIKKTAVNCPRGSEFLTMAERLTPGTVVPVPVLFGFNENLGIYEVYAEEIKSENVIGRIEKLLDGKGSDIPLSELENLKFGYDMRITGKEAANILTAYIDDLIPEGVADTKKDVRGTEFEKERRRIIDNDICPEETLDENIEIMERNGVAEYLILKVLKKYKKYKKPAHVPKTCYVDATDPSESETLFSKCLRNAVDGFAIVYTGDKSVGKNVCAETIAKVMYCPLFMVNFSAGMGRDEVFGSKSTDNSAASNLNLELAFAYVQAQKLGKDADEKILNLAAEFELHRAKAASVAIVQEVSEFVEWLDVGGVMVFNEMNMAEANFFQSFANPLTDNTGFINCPGIGRVEINPNCVLIGGQNAGYKGTREQNTATMSRFGRIDFPYPKNIEYILEAALKGRLDKKYIKETNKLYMALLANVKSQAISDAALNIRGFVRALDSVALNGCRISLTEEIKIHVINNCPPKDISALITTTLEHITL